MPVGGGAAQFPRVAYLDFGHGPKSWLRRNRAVAFYIFLADEHTRMSQGHLYSGGYAARQSGNRDIVL
jgi:hypothetical protein